MQELVQQVRSWWRSEREELELQLCRSSSSSSSSSPRPRPTPTAASARKQRPNNRGRGFFSYCSTTPLPRQSQQRNDLGLPSTYPPTYLDLPPKQPARMLTLLVGRKANRESFRKSVLGGTSFSEGRNTNYSVSQHCKTRQGGGMAVETFTPLNCYPKL